MIENKDRNQLGQSEAKNMLIKRNAQGKSIDYKILSFRRHKHLKFNFRDYKEFFKEIY